ncbi:DNA gyrase inhibitor YacG [Chitinibacter sp. FCG-7]|uniref:DNA gyrase inhibitor YacG n=1 Tax=Chitinibacter mangrovi TaxID=3153927 RepID=A0AAU7FDK8_9NEIS
MTTSNPTTPQVKCPTCGQLSPYSPQNAFRPFCSERCKLIDLGEWASESYRIPDNSQSPTSADDGSLLQ